MSKTSKIMWAIAAIVLIVLIGVIGFGYFQKLTYHPENPVATMEVQDFGTIKIELYPSEAPETVANFIALSNRGFYDGLTFHRIIKDFMVQGGAPEGNGTGGAKISNLRDLKDGEEDREYTIKGEFIANGVNNKIQMDEGVIAMARSDYSQYSSSLTKDSYNSGSSQFFIVTKTSPSIDGLYTPFGKVTEGLDVLHKIEEVEVKAAEGSEEDESAEVSTPVNAPKILSIRVDTKGVDYGLPETLEPFDYTTWLYKQYGIDAGSVTSTIE